MEPSELRDELDDLESVGKCPLHYWLVRNDPEYIPEFARLLDQRRDSYPLSAEKASVLLKRVGVTKGAGKTTVAKHRDEERGCEECQQLFVKTLPSDA